jgi:hypothetical protein
MKMNIAIFAMAATFRVLSDGSLGFLKQKQRCIPRINAAWSQRVIQVEFV